MMRLVSQVSGIAVAATVLVLMSGTAMAQAEGMEFYTVTHGTVQVEYTGWDTTNDVPTEITFNLYSEDPGGGEEYVYTFPTGPAGWIPTPYYDGSKIVLIYIGTSAMDIASPPYTGLPTIMFGAGGSDSLTGGTEQDALYGGAGDDELNGEGGADLLYGGAGDDELNGGTGDDEAIGGIDCDEVNGDEGVDTLYGGGGDDLVFGGEGGDFAYGDGISLFGEGDDDVSGDGGNDTCFGNGGHDSMISTSNPGAMIDGGAGDDFLFGGTGRDEIFGGAGNDGSPSLRLTGGLGDDCVWGNGGNDCLGKSSDELGDLGCDIFYPGTGMDDVWTADSTNMDTLMLSDDGIGGDCAAIDASDTVSLDPGDIVIYR